MSAKQMPAPFTQPYLVDFDQMWKISITTKAKNAQDNRNSVISNLLVKDPVFVFTKKPAFYTLACSSFFDQQSAAKKIAPRRNQETSSVLTLVQPPCLSWLQVAGRNNQVFFKKCLAGFQGLKPPLFQIFEPCNLAPIEFFVNAPHPLQLAQSAQNPLKTA
ncbi:hypothetical protein C4546_00925 [Candidatus Parcubacteria bacterium]|jgi:hypothetical protein|nr:MAG: hypothetical protein C4546_00925 [Candidatus Parcubacteria bacterium]